MSPHFPAYIKFDYRYHMDDVELLECTCPPGLMKRVLEYAEVAQKKLMDKIMSEILYGKADK